MLGAIQGAGDTVLNKASSEQDKSFWCLLSSGDVVHHPEDQGICRIFKKLYLISKNTWLTN